METQTQMSNNSEDGGVDLISGLPDETIHRILSFLSVEDVNQFRVVSKRFLSATTSSLVFDFAAFPKRSSTAKHLDFKNESRWKQSERENEAFLNFVQDSIEQHRRRMPMMKYMERLRFRAPISLRYASED